MRDIFLTNNPHNDDKVIDACSLFGAMDTTGRPFSGVGVIKAIANMHFRGNGLGGGFAIYGLYPGYADLYAFHIMYASQTGREKTEELLKNAFELAHTEEVPTQPTPAI